MEITNRVSGLKVGRDGDEVMKRSFCEMKDSAGRACVNKFKAGKLFEESGICFQMEPEALHVLKSRINICKCGNDLSRRNYAVEEYRKLIHEIASRIRTLI